jgi:archaellum biogenesis protein FlaJ (TadC family)
VFVFAAIVLSIVAALVVPLVSGRPREQTAVLAIAAMGLALLAVTTLLYVAAEDDYRDAGVSRWSTYDAQGVTVAAIVTAVVASASAFVALRRRRLAFAVPLTTIVAVLLSYLAMAEMTN